MQEVKNSQKEMFNLLSKTKFSGFPSILASQWETREENQSTIRETEVAFSLFI